MKLTHRRLALAGILIGAVSIASPAHSSSIPDEQWVRPSEIADGFQGFLLQDQRVSNGFSWLTAANGVNSYVCTGINQGDCLNANSYSFNAVLPACKNSQDLDCIEAISATTVDGKILRGTFKDYVWTNHINKYEANQSLGLPVGSAPSLWEITGADHSEGNMYLVSASLSGGGTKAGLRNTDFNLNLYAASIHNKVTPISFNTDPTFQAWMDTMRQGQDADGITRTYGAGPGEYDNVQCASYTQDPMKCVVANPFPLATTYQISLRLSSEPTGWLHGRMDKPDISINPLQGTSVGVKISAKPVKTPIVYFGAQFSTLPSDVQELYKSCGAWPTCSYRSSRQAGQDGVGKKANPLTRNMTSNPPPWGSNTVKELQIWLPLVNNKAVATPDTWSIHTLGRDQFGSSNKCFTSGSGVLGIVTTNASAYSEGPPLFTNGSLSYQVSAPHFASDGSVFKGTYNLSVRSEVARCLYGFSSAPIQASIDVIDNEGSKSIATTSFSESNGWDKLSANNFEFSSPTIKVSLSQNSTSSSLPTEPDRSKKTVVLQPKSTIVCIKGKTLKTISGSNPKCPSGYKKK